MENGTTEPGRRLTGALPGLRPMSAALALAVAVSVPAGSETVFAAPAEVAAAAAKGQQQYATSAQDLASARVLARLSGQRVEALGSAPRPPPPG